MSAPRIELSPAARATIESAARRAWPLEACGFLLGRDCGTLRAIERAREVRNVLAAPARFAVDPREHLAVEEEAALRGESVLGVWHSHPDRPALPSAEDDGHAVDGWSSLIVAVTARGVSDLRAYRVTTGTFVRESV